MHANIDSALSPANCVSGCVTEITYMVYLVARIIFAGMLTHIFTSSRCLLGPPAKNTHVVPYVPRLEYAKSIQLRSRLRLRLLEGLKRSSIPR